MTLQEKIQNKVEEYRERGLASVFLEGAEFALNNQWISVDEDLPCNHDELIDGSSTVEVFAACKNGYFSSTYMIKGLKKWGWYDFKPDYWMIPPKLPKE